ncbi:MAG: hypothetical protein NXI30_04595 [bacterium]|nr:hypothetical protein [bacterium]
MNDDQTSLHELGQEAQAIDLWRQREQEYESTIRTLRDRISEQDNALDERLMAAHNVTDVKLLSRKYRAQKQRAEAAEERVRSVQEAARKTGDHNVRLLLERDEARAKVADLKQQEDLLEQDVARLMRERNEARYVAAEMYDLWWAYQHADRGAQAAEVDAEWTAMVKRWHDLEENAEAFRSLEPQPEEMCESNPRREGENRPYRNLFDDDEPQPAAEHGGRPMTLDEVAAAEGEAHPDTLKLRKVREQLYESQCFLNGWLGEAINGGNPKRIVSDLVETGPSVMLSAEEWEELEDEIDSAREAESDG